MIIMKLCVLTYNVVHRKTYDTLCLLKTKGYDEVLVIAQPMHYKKKFRPLIEHRPECTIQYPETKDICERFGYEYTEGTITEQSFDEDMIFLVCGAGILPEEFVKRHRIINSHPGYIPLARGLDAYKWEIYEDKPIGVTTHFLGEYVDAGEVIECREIAVREHDTFHSVAQRVYETEVDMLVSALEKIEQEHIYIEPGDNVLHKRMPNELEQDIFEKFERRRENENMFGGG